MIVGKTNAAGEQVAKSRFWRFSLKTLLIALTIFCLWFGNWANNGNRQRLAVEAIGRNGGQFRYDYQRTPSPPGPLGGEGGVAFSYKASPPGPAWLRRVLGDHFFITPVSLTMSQTIIEGGSLTYLDALPHIESVDFRELKLRKSDLAHLNHLTNLRTLGIRECTFSGGDAPRGSTYWNIFMS